MMTQISGVLKLYGIQCWKQCSIVLQRKNLFTRLDYQPGNVGGFYEPQKSRGLKNSRLTLCQLVCANLVETCLGISFTEALYHLTAVNVEAVPSRRSICQNIYLLLVSVRCLKKII